MLFDAILETVTGVTTGDLVTAGVTNRPRFSDFFTSNASEISADPFYYSVVTQDAIPIVVEEGIGWLSATGNIKRNPIVTFASGVPTHWGSAAALVSGTTYNVICTPEAGSLPLNIHDYASLTGSGLFRGFMCQHMTGVASVGTSVKDRMVYTPIRIESVKTITKLRSLNGGTAGTSGTRGWRIGLYTCQRSGLPGRKIAESGDIASTSFGAISYTLGTALRLPPGWYYVALCQDYAGTLPTVYSHGNNGNVSIGNTPLGLVDGPPTAVVGCYEALSGGWTSLPSTANATQTAITPGGGVYAPAVWLGVA